MRVWTVKFQNELQIGVFKYFGVILMADFINDEKQKLKLQYNKNVRFGFLAVI